MKKLKVFLKFLLFYAVIPFVASLPACAVGMSYSGKYLTPIIIISVPVFALIFYALLKRFSKLDGKDYKLATHINGIAVLAFTAIFTIMMIIAKGEITSSTLQNFMYLAFQFIPSSIVPFLGNKNGIIFATVFATYAVGYIFCGIASKAIKPKKIIAPVLCVAVCLGSCTYLYSNRPSEKYKGHGFDYLGGYSSTDFTDYTVYAENSKLVTLNHEPLFTIENEADMPILDGAEACYPLYSAFAKAVYKGIDKIEEKALSNEEYKSFNGKIVSFTNTIDAFERLISTDSTKVDMVFGARPSKSQLEEAAEAGIELEITPIGKEAFVFFVENNNPVDNLKSDEIRKIYSGEITDWSKLGGNNQKITAFQRPENSGSQTMMEYFMGDVKMQEPMEYETVDAMLGVIREVAQYNNEKGAIGYTFRYFLEELNQEQNVKMISVDGVHPTLESVENGTYPLTVDLCLITRKNNDNPNVEKMKEFILSDDGQYIIHQTGYGKLSK